MPKLTVVPPSEPTPAEAITLRVKRAPKPPTMLQCNRCGSRTLIETKTGVLFVSGKPQGGTKQLVCATCLMQGEHVVVA